MKKLITFLKNQQQYFILYLVAAFVFFTVSWFVTHAPATDVPTSFQSQGMANAAVDEFTPDATNVSQSASQQLDALRLRVVNAPEDTTHVFRLARMLQDAHQLDEAARNYKHYLAMRPRNRQAWLDYAQTLGGMSAWTEALGVIEEMLVLYPDDPSGRYNLGAIYANQSLIEKAEAVWNELAAQNDDPEIASMAKASLEKLKSFVKPGKLQGRK